MALRIGDLAANSSVNSTDEFELSLTGSAGSKKVTAKNLRSSLLAGGSWTAADHLDLGAAAPATGKIRIDAGTITVTSAPAVSSIATWNDGAVTFTHLLHNVTSTASAAASLFFDLQLAGVSKFSVRKDGLITGVAGLTISSGTSALQALTATTGTFSSFVKISGSQEFIQDDGTLGTRLGPRFSATIGAVGTTSNHAFDLYTNNIRRGGFSAGGIFDFVSGITIASTANSVLTNSVTSNSRLYILLANTTGALLMGTEGSLGAEFLAGSPAWDVVIRAPSGISFGADNTNVQFRIASTGNVGIISGKKLNLDGIVATGDTYLQESSANNLIAVAGGSTMLAIGSTSIVIAHATTDNIGFFANAGASQQTPTGSRAGNAALASLLTKLAQYGLIVDGTSA